MAPEQIILVGLIVFAIAAALVLAVLQGRPVRLKLPFGIEIKLDAGASPPGGDTVSRDDQEAIRVVISQHNIDFERAVGERDIRVLEQTVTKNGMAQVRSNVEAIRKELQSNSGFGAECKDINWIGVERVDSNTVRVTTDERWEWIYPNGRMPTTARNTYTLKRIRGTWRIDHAEVFRV